MDMNCDHCKLYDWYYDKCKKFDCKVDFREVHNCFQKQEPYLPSERDTYNEMLKKKSRKIGININDIMELRNNSTEFS